MGKLKLKHKVLSLSRLAANCHKLTLLDSCSLPLKSRTQDKCRICIAQRT